MTLEELNLLIKREEKIIKELKGDLKTLKEQRAKMTKHGDLTEIREYFFKKYPHELERVKRKAFLHVVGKVVGIETLSREQYDNLIEEIKRIAIKELPRRKES